MSAYDDAVAYLDAEVHPRCDYDIYSYMRDIVDEMEAENDKLRELTRRLYECARHSACATCKYAEDACDFEYDMRELGI